MSKLPHIRAVNGGDTDKAPAIEAAGSAQESAADELLLVEQADTTQESWYDEPEAPRSYQWAAPALALVTAAAWTVFFCWVHLGQMAAGAPAQQWAGWISSWATPILLIAAIWLIVMRSSTREASRFADAAQALSGESARLEDRLVTVNRELSLAREFLTAQTRELEFLGRSASERLSTHADHLQSLIRDNGAQVDSLATISTNALDNMNKLRDSLPVIANSARDVSNQIGSAGRTAQSQLGELVTGFERLNEFGAASERQVASLRTRVDEAIEAFGTQADQLETIANRRFAALTENSETFRGDLDSREVEALATIRARAEALRLELLESHAATRSQEETALAAMRERLANLREEAGAFAMGIRDGETVALGAWSGQIEAMQDRLREAIGELQALDGKALESAQRKLAALREEAQAVDAKLGERDRLFHEEVARRRSELTAAEDGALERLNAQLASLDTAISERREAQLAQMAMLAEQGEALGGRIAALGDQFTIIAGQGDEARGTLAQGIEALNAKLNEGREALDGTDMAVAALTDASVRLLELLQASAKQSRDDLPTAMSASETRLIDIERRAEEIRDLLDQARISGEAVTASMAGADAQGREAMAAVDAFHTRFGETAATQAGEIERLRADIAALNEESQSTAERVQGELRNAIIALEESARSALAGIESEQAERIAHIAGTVGEKSAEAIERAMTEHGESAIARLDEASSKSVDAGREAARQLRDQLAKVNELTANLETRVLRARERAEEQIDNDFSRRVALITESLNSNAIDIARAMSSEVTDVAWASYLRGDRGIFTRRAVRLLDTAEARAIVELYDADAGFKEHVNRYIHDFEAMLRVMLSTRDGNAVSVTLLSSDMGKLYVALAQAIERLRQ